MRKRPQLEMFAGGHPNQRQLFAHTPKTEARRPSRSKLPESQRYGAFVSRVDRRRARQLLAKAVREKRTLTPAAARQLYEDLTRALRHLEIYGHEDPRNVALRRRISRMLTVVRHRAEGRGASRDRSKGYRR